MEIERINPASDDKTALEKIAAEKRVSIAWVIRDAISEYLAGRAESSPAPGKSKG